jgi:hypothetical protein
VVRKVFELIVGRFAAGQIDSMEVQEKVRPLLRIRTAQVAQRIHRQSMVRVAALGGENELEEQGHESQCVQEVARPVERNAIRGRSFR